MRADNQRLVHAEIQRMALDELRGARKLTQADLAEMLGVPQSSISRIEQRADMYLSTLRNYIQAAGGELRIEAVFPDGATVMIDRFGEYEAKPYVVHAVAEGRGTFRLHARPLHHRGADFSTRTLKAAGLTRAMRAIHLPEAQIAAIKSSLELCESNGEFEIGGRSSSIQRVFNVSELIAAGFEETISDKPPAPVA